MGPRPVREMKPGLVRLGLTLKGFFGDPVALATCYAARGTSQTVT
ncbi:hypothetical protein I545_2323 [Mycobacterium kansasii 662]|uniref:Uncharacterized protein n=3 Tax=Mycobacterium kansasii TaxID=1768 RepID=A0A1V3XMU8_MYCKA|nr:hypothetical protein MKAN_05545 [Mycobacterium kansasii ATCC 12478]EUA01257.1 hypothetical protein I547_4196 [Mycobacterium kansasii 824]EUA20058.1 hypothetical protein I545_2323 [Mycobacterium kansasii 662]KEP40245.1 hypothetical protein MKSMC1_45890 [Mycobacterium kansasii]OOK80525.1 hypothetical protein BZL29_1898 [Mycobacterium kansasii]